jgi:hypothetical protein
MSQRPTSPAPPDFNRPRSSSTDDVHPPRSTTPNTARPSAFPSRGALLVSDVSGSSTADHNTSAIPTVSGASRRLAFLSEKLSGQTSKSAKSTPPNINEPVQASLLPPRSHSRADSRESAYSSSVTLATSCAAASSKTHISPSKVRLVVSTQPSLNVMPFNVFPLHHRYLYFFSVSLGRKIYGIDTPFSFLLSPRPDAPSTTRSTFNERCTASPTCQRQSRRLSRWRRGRLLPQA